MVADARLYDQLGVRTDASPAQIRQSYREAALRFHPDRNPDDPEAAAETFKACQAAYEILSDPRKRAAYDAYGMNSVRPAASAAAASASASAASAAAAAASAAAAEAAADFEQQRREFERAQRHRWDSLHEQQRARQQDFASQFSAFDPFDSFAPFGNMFTNMSSNISSFFNTFDNMAYTTRQQPAWAANPTNTSTDHHGHSHNQPRAQAASWSFNVSSSNGADGTYSTRYHTWNNVDGHRSGSHRGVLGDGGGNGQGFHGRLFPMHGFLSSSRGSHQQQWQQQQQTGPWY